ncbi:MAG TPA: DUF4184 family protein, partial [Gemmatimonadaceae bacterium]|nr:DUF4184 family protein [Gemmatimonadaceae bacterium]
PAAALPVWPFVRRGVIPLAPFVLGAMVPDFEYLFRLEPLSLVSHSARGLLVFCLPVGVAAWLLWEMLLRPVGHDLVALPDASSGGGAAWGRGVLALMLGSASHVAWDAFTHRYTWVADRWPLLRETAFRVGGSELPWFGVFQHASTVIGGGVVLWWLVREVRAGGASRAALLAPPRLRAWTALGIAAVVVGLWNAPRRGEMVHVRRAPLVAGRFVVGAMDGMAVAFALLAARRRWGARARTRDEEPRDG